MIILKYSVQLDHAPDGIIVTFPDFPYGATSGQNEEEALENAVYLLETIIRDVFLYNEKEIKLPQPSEIENCHTVSVNIDFKI